MLIYVSHRFYRNPANYQRAERITHDLQMSDPDNCYICPLVAFPFIRNRELDEETEMDICLDLLSACDKMIVASDLSRRVAREIDFANLVDMEVEYLE